MSTETAKKENYIKRFKIMVMGFLKQGTSPKKLAATITIGISMGLIPIVGINALICAIIALIWRLNLPLIQIVNFMFFPVQLLLIVPYFKLSKLFFTNVVMPFTWDTFWTLFKSNWWEAIKQVAIADGMAITAWFVVSIPLSFIIYFISYRILVFVKAKKMA
jgi:uncharacterized protein (DUF2062 family)